MDGFKFGILGGDYRYKLLSELLSSDGYDVYNYGCNFLPDNADNLNDLAEKSNIIIGAVPCTKNDEKIAAVRSEIGIYDLFNVMQKNGIRVFAGGVVKDNVKYAARKYGIMTYDFFDIEEVSVRNAIPTAEGSVMIAMKESERTIFNSKCLVLGCGRCGKILAKTLKGLGAKVTVTYRKESDGVYLESDLMTPLKFNNLSCCIYGFDFIFNTVPSTVLDAEMLKLVSRKTIIIDIAQAPGGVDYSMASTLNIKALYCPGLPGRCAPMTAAEIIKKAVVDIALSSGL